MNFEKQSLIYVYLFHGAEKIPVGRLLLKDRHIFFEYTDSFLNQNLMISPFNLPLKKGVIQSKDTIFDGLFGVFNDSLPDGWGRLLLDRKLLKSGINADSLSPLDRLCFAGSNTMGALIYEPENPNSSLIYKENLDEIYEEIEKTEDNSDDFLDELITMGGSSAGARPKVLITIKNTDWLIKFKSPYDPKDIAGIEYAYHLMAKDAGIDVPNAKVFESKKYFGYFGVERFDRKNKERIHMHTISGLLHADHRESFLDYETIMRVTLYLTKDIKECEKKFERVVFNVLTHNRDDHSKNFSFLMSLNGDWKLSPAYDLTFSNGPNGEHATTLMGEGKNPSLNHLIKLADLFDIKKTTVIHIVDKISSTVNKWSDFADKASVSKQQQKFIKETLDRIRINLKI